MSRWVQSAVVCLLLTAAVCVLLLYLSAYSEREHTPVQTIPFVHHTHTAPELAAMPCLACHKGAEQGAQAGLPPAELCLDCHRHILADDPRLLPLHAAANPDSPVYTGAPLRYQRNSPLPAHVHMDHAAHSAAGMACEECHPTPGSQPSYSMRACLNCHREHNLPTDCSGCHL